MLYASSFTILKNSITSIFLETQLLVITMYPWFEIESLTTESKRINEKETNKKTDVKHVQKHTSHYLLRVSLYCQL